LNAFPNSIWAPRFSDFFQFGHHIPLRDGSIGTLDGPVTGWTDDLDKYHGHPLPQIDAPQHFGLETDRPLLARLFAAWDRNYLKQRGRVALRRLFRSLEIAFQASRYPSDGLTTPHDVGTRLGLWVSAFEVLFHPVRGEVNKDVVLARIGQIPWLDAQLTRKRYRIWRQRRPISVTLPEVIYDDVYGARNRFMHGEQITYADQHFRRSKRRLPLAILTPILYNASLRVFLDKEIPMRLSLDDEAHDFFPGAGPLG
jgi:hypothetical protein